MTHATPGSPASTHSSLEDEEDVGVGLSDRKLSEGRRHMLDLINRLHSTGVQTDMDLPQIAVIGAQSAGKSSLIESISGITLPRAAGTCTRCPTECRLSSSKERWKCIVSLRFITDAKGQPLGQARNDQFGTVIYNKNEVEERIRRAQRAILNPSTSAHRFLDDDDHDPDVRELTFSTNCVSLQISGKDVADLSFCDLPGLIASVGKGGNNNDIEMVKNLVTSYVSKPSCLILLTVACETDFENQGAHHLAKLHDPLGKRTIGVLTKPDRIPPGEEDRWLRFIRNEYETLDNGWYCVKQPNSKTLAQGISWTEARAQENEYFSMNPPWSSLESTYQAYLRTVNLTERLSIILSELISKRLPEIHEELQKLLHQTEGKMRELPKPPSSDAFGEVLHLVGDFARDLSRHLEGTPEEDGLMQRIRQAQLRFRTAIRATAPRFRPYEKKFLDARTLPSADFLSDEENEDEHSFGVIDTAIYVDEVYERAQIARTRELPDNYPFVVQQTYISSITTQWRDPALKLFDDVYQIQTECVQKIVDKHFGRFSGGIFQQRVQIVVKEHLEHCQDRARERINWLMDLERRAFTLNTHYYSDYKDKFLSYYRGCREKDADSTLMARLQEYKEYKSKFPTELQTAVSQILASLPKVGITGAKAIDLAKLLPPDPMEPALIIMAGVRAYFQVAYKRFADLIPLAIDYEFVLGMERGIEEALYAGLDIGGNNGRQTCEELIQEPVRISKRRDLLQRQRDRLMSARAELLRVGV